MQSIDYSGSNWNDVFNEMRLQGVSGLVGSVLGKVLGIDTIVKSQWKEHIIHQVILNEKIISLQNQIQSLLNEKGIKSVVIKGTSSAAYYPNPIYRNVGDIDILVMPDQYDQACYVMVNAGYKTVMGQTSKRHTSFNINGVHVEIHHRFTAFGSKQSSVVLDEMIYSVMRKCDEMKYEGTLFSSLPQLENGLVILEHIAHHLRTGIGLKHIVDWMMYVNACVDNEYWDTCFEEKVNMLGLQQFTKVITKMCTLYLGLPIINHEWCKNADTTVCTRLIKFIIESGNHAVKKNGIDGKAEKVLNTKGTKLIIQLQNSGTVHWGMASKYRIMRPFAIIYAVIRYASLYFKQRTIGSIWKMLMVKRNNQKLFKQLDL
ncbi:MAG: nucleotidyltransferase family protein [Candidatus Pacebacteria bacterium]|nr:nucleotidyltransferase family protein [Candidatus Paceibacterota bacterium]